MKKYHCTLLVFLFFIGFLQSQSAERFEEAVKLTLHKDHFFADDEFFGITTKDSLSVKNQFVFAEAAKKMGAFEIAEQGYYRTMKLDTLDGDIDYPKAIYWVGSMKKLQGKYIEALPFFEQYLASPPPVDNTFLAWARKDIEDCKWAATRTQKIDNQYEVRHLGEEVNSPYSDFAPLLMGDHLYFSSLKFEKTKEKVKPPRLYAKTLSSEENRTATPADDFNRLEQSVSHLTFTKEEKRVYFTICDYQGKSRKIRCQLYYQDKQADNSWSKAQMLPKHINLSGFTTTHPAVAYNEEGKERLFFVSDRPEGKGKLDVWFTEVDERGAFAPPINYAAVNTAENEVSPFYHQPSNTLYFSSKGNIGLGGYDIYRFSNGEIVHGGYPLNSSFDDLYFTLDPTGDKGHLSSSRDGCFRLNEHDMGCHDIFAVDFINIDLQALTFDDYTKEALVGTKVQLFQVSEKEEEPLLVDARTNELDNEFHFDNLKRDSRYFLIATKEGYVPDTLYFHTRDITTSTTLVKELYLRPNVFEMDLLALTFDEESRLPLHHCIVQLIDLATGELFIKDNPAGNNFNFDIFSQRKYRLIASLVGYVSDTLDFDTKEFVNETTNRTITKRLYLRPGGLVELEDLLPLTLYFDNDRPDPRSRTTTTASNYEDLYTAYYRKKREFMSNYAKGFSGEKYIFESSKIAAFFETQLRGNFDTLGVFSETLIKYLQRGNTAVISVRGFTSPLANSEYNKRLGKRRVSAVMNHFINYRDGMLKEYLDNGSLVLQEVSFGEEQAPKFISENPRDRRNSVYSPEASKERKVQIVEITIGEKREGE